MENMDATSSARSNDNGRVSPEEMEQFFSQEPISVAEIMITKDGVGVSVNPGIMRDVPDAEERLDRLSQALAHTFLDFLPPVTEGQ